MGLFVIGINHTTAPVKLREQVAFSAETLVPALSSLHRLDELSSAMILSTCNRTEIYALTTVSETQSSAEGSTNVARDAVVAWLAEHHHSAVSELAPSLYWHEDRDAVHHLIRVSAGLDSMVLGEAQIFGQVKDAFAAAEAPM